MNCSLVQRCDSISFEPTLFFYSKLAEFYEYYSLSELPLSIASEFDPESDADDDGLFKDAALGEISLDLSF